MISTAHCLKITKKSHLQFYQFFCYGKNALKKARAVFDCLTFSIDFQTLWPSRKFGLTGSFQNVRRLLLYF